MRPATYVSVLIRSHLRMLAPLPKDELLALKRSIAELATIGRNINQIAKAANEGGMAQVRCGRSSGRCSKSARRCATTPRRFSRRTRQLGDGACPSGPLGFEKASPFSIWSPMAAEARARNGRHFTPAQVEQIRRTVQRAPEAVVKVLPRDSNDLKAVGKHLDYIGRKRKARTGNR
jgi:hypothetical protein